MIKSLKWNYLALFFIFISVSAFAAKLNVENVLKGHFFPRDIVIIAEPKVVDMRGMMARFKVVDISGVQTQNCHINANLLESQADDNRFFAFLESISCQKAGERIVRRASGQVNGQDAPFDGLQIICEDRLCLPNTDYVSVVLTDSIHFSTNVFD